MLSDSFNAHAATAAGETSLPPVPWKPWIGVLFALAVFYLSQVIAGLAVSVYPSLKGWTHARTLEWVDGSVWAQFAFVLIAESFTIGAIYIFLKRYKAGFASIGLQRPRWSDPVYGLLAVPAYLLLYGLTVGIVGHFISGLDVDQQQQIGFNNVSGSVALIVTFVSLVVLPALAEEIMVRGFLYGTLKKAMPTVGAVLVTSALFAAAHLPEGGPAGPLYIAALDTFVLSLVLIYLREATGSLWAGITLHASKNGIAFVYLFVLHLK